MNELGEPIEVRVEIHSNNVEIPSTYRLYADNDLITERTWIWPSSVYIEECFFVTMKPGKHNITIEPHLSTNKFNIANPRIDGRSQGEINGLTLQFMV